MPGQLQLAILNHLYRHGPQRAGDITRGIADEWETAQNTVCQTLYRMRGYGLVACEVSRENRRWYRWRAAVCPARLVKDALEGTL